MTSSREQKPKPTGISAFESAMLDRLDALVANQVYLNQQLFLLTRKGSAIMATLEDLQAAVENETSVSSSVITLLNSLSSQLADALAATDSVVTAEQVQGVIDQITANAQALADAVTANTPAA